MAPKRTRPADWPIDLGARAFLAALLVLPYRWRVPAAGWLLSRVLAPLAGWPRRVDENLRHVRPALSARERRHIARGVADNAGRTLIEIYSGDRFIRHVAGTPLEGPGAEALEAAHREDRPVILVTGHFGNFNAPRVAMVARGYRIGGLYRPMRNQHFNRHYVAALAHLGKPIFPSGRAGLGGLLRHLRSGGMMALLVDIYVKGGAPLDFMGQPAPTALSAAELALRHDAPLIAAYGIRQPDGLSFRIHVDAPVARGSAEEMTQALNDSLAAQVDAHIEQWFWIHRRWKPERQRARAAASTGP
jgi:KDO2-lipid IV(A) lauroyltransferase